MNLPDGTTHVGIQCSKCKAPIQTFTETDLDTEMEVKIVSHRGWYHKKTVPIFHPFRRIVLCNKCTDERIAERESVEARSIAQRWRILCPESYRETKVHMLPSPARLDRVMRWTYGPKGLLLIGNTGKGKSRCAWKLVEREFMKGRSVECIDSRFSMQYAQKVSISGASAFEWLDSKMTSDILLMDDALKVRLENSGAEMALFAVIEERMAHKRPIILTTQDTGETLRSRMSQDRGEAIVRRLRECCETISFD